MISLTISGDVIPAGRPRFTRQGHAYQPKANVEYRASVQEQARQALRGQAPLTGELSVVLKVYRKFNPTSRRFGDVDNHAKGLFDAFNKIVYHDDSQIVQCYIEKIQDKDDPRAEIQISNIPPISAGSR